MALCHCDSSIDRMSRRIEDELVKAQIQPPAKFETNVRHRCGSLESKTFVQGHAAGIGRIDAADQDVVILLPGALDDLFEQELSDPSTPICLRHVQRMLDGVFVGRNWAQRAGACNANKMT